MGYRIDVSINDFIIPAEKVADCLKKINDLYEPEVMDSHGGGGSYDGNKLTKHYSWVQDSPEGGFTSLVEAFYAWRYEAGDCGNGDVEVISFNGEKLGDDPFFFGEIAPFVKETAEIYFVGEDGLHWKLAFKGGKCKEHSGKVVYDDED